MPLQRFGILGALAVLPVTAQVYAPVSPQAKVEARRHGLATVQRRPDGSRTSPGWSGYAATAPKGSITDVKGSWIVPAVICSGSSNSLSAFWVGIDGLKVDGKANTTLEQIGTESDCNNGTPNYYAWYEFLPQDPTEIILFTVAPGDTISAEVSYGGGQFTVTIKDETTGASSGPISAAVVGAQQSTVEWIAEAPSIGTVIQPLADFGTVVYGNDYTNITNTCDATVGAQTGPIGSLPNSFPITMVNNDNGTIEAIPSPLSSDESSFSVTWQGLTTLLSFDGTNGEFPTAKLLQAANGDFYGTTDAGGANGVGTVFKITPGGLVTTLYSFCSQSGCTDGEYPKGGLVQATNGDFYGTTAAGGASGSGTVFKITPSGKLTRLYSFCSQSNCTDGGGPYAGLVQATNGDFYGTTDGFGANGNYGTIFKITPGGTLTTLYSFCGQSGCTDGEYTYAGLVQAANGDFYGTTSQGGAGSNCPYTWGCGTVFKITPGGTLTTLHRFNGTDGYEPGGPLVQASDGNLYGITYADGANGRGTVFKITPGGTLTTLYSFCGQSGCTDGEFPWFGAGLVQATNGDFYGTTSQGGLANDGTVFSLSVGLGPFVETQPTSGKVGAAVKILGTNLTGATNVSFNGTAAVFKVISSSEITTTVPTGATTGKVQVVTPSATLSSNIPFGVP